VKENQDIRAPYAVVDKALSETVLSKALSGCKRQALSESKTKLFNGS